MLIDTHAHLFYPNFEDDLEEVIQRAENAGIDFILVPATDLQSAEKVIKLTEQYDMIYGAVGIHPHETKEWSSSLVEEIESLAGHNKIVAIGEIGLDYYYDYSPKEKQIEAFKSQIDLALKLDLPIIVHNRDSDEDMMEIIGSYCGSGLKAQFHCFNGSQKDAYELMHMGYMISFTGNITFKKADKLREILKNIRIDQILLETDSPFLTPVPFRGKRNEPANVKFIAEQVAEAHNLSVADVGRITSFNAFRIFGIGSKTHTSFTYKIGNSLYINITNRCDSHCSFCRRKSDPVLKGYNLGMERSEEPDAEFYIKELGDPAKYKEIIFCGYGEPTIRWDIVKQISRYVKGKGGRTRLNTNGHGSHINKRNITPEFKGLIDVVSISLNSFNAKHYVKLMGIETGMFNEMVSFAKNVKNYVEKVIMTIVSVDEVDIAKARKTVEEKIGAEYRARPYI
ncbi:MAG: YchF/TatD family DNA exonuclease [Ignavibacteria bacterium]|nr:YchF/TatD family DNA exonuclease [Ignavibacteria bacterium]